MERPGSGTGAETGRSATRLGPTLDRHTWPSLASAPPPVLLVPLGSTEQHGPHLPLGTDTLVADAVAHRAALVLASAGEVPGTGGDAAPDAAGDGEREGEGEGARAAPGAKDGDGGGGGAAPIPAGAPTTGSGRPIDDGPGGDDTGGGLGARDLEAVVTAPVPFGSSGEHAGFPGTLSIGQAALELVVVELVRSADAFAGVVLVCGHAGNAEPVRRAVTTGRAEGRRVAAWFPTAPGGDAHAGRTETSLVLALHPELVDLAHAAAGATAPVGELLDVLRAGGVAAVSANGVLGDPAGASAEEGEALLARFATEVAALAAEVAGARPAGG